MEVFLEAASEIFQDVVSAITDSLATGEGRSILGALVNMVLLFLLYVDMKSRSWRALLVHGILCLAATAGFAFWASRDPKWIGFPTTFLVLIAVPAVLWIVGIVLSFFSSGSSAGQSQAAPQQQNNQYYNEYYNQYGRQVDLHGSYGSYQDDRGNPYTAYDNFAVSQRHLRETEDGDMIYVTYDGSEYIDDFGNHYRMYGSVLSRV